MSLQEKKDIESREDLVALLQAFYREAMQDPLIGHFFTRVVHLDLDAHLPVIVDFWESVLLKGNNYRKNAMLPHLHLNSLSPIEERHFTRWLQLFGNAIDASFEGATAELAKQRAQSLATIMRIKILQSST